MTVPDLIPIPAGTIVLRDARSGSEREVTLEPFEISATPVAEQGVPLHGLTWFDAIRWCNRASASAGLREVYTRDGREVTWDTTANGYRLPTEAEWEYACRAGSAAATHGALADIAPGRRRMK